MVVLRATLLALAVAAVCASVATAAPPLRLQHAQRCVALWNRSSPVALKSSVVQTGPITAMVVGTSVLLPGPALRCSLLLMMPNGTWYATETPTRAGAVRWSALRRLQDGAAARYTGMPGTAMATVRSDGKLALA